ncbi:hypothetical protein CKA32_000597 [Geitlerinema sp. FC II]|nr:hypothetical protein CKA32_000597 [Geitlerinema sp. FC II]
MQKVAEKRFRTPEIERSSKRPITMLVSVRVRLKNDRLNLGIE